MATRKKKEPEIFQGYQYYSQRDDPESLCRCAQCDSEAPIWWVEGMDGGWCRYCNAGLGQRIRGGYGDDARMVAQLIAMSMNELEKALKEGK